MADEGDGDVDPGRPMLLTHALRVFFPMGGMTVSGLRKERDRGTLAVYRMAGRDYTTISAMREMMELCRVQPVERRSPYPQPSLSSRRDKRDIEAARNTLRKTLDELKEQDRAKREKEKAEREAEQERAQSTFKKGREVSDDIPAALVAILDALFPPGCWLASHPDTARTLGVSDKTLKPIGDEGRIRYRLRGKTWRVYAREDIEAYVRRPPERPVERRPTMNVGKARPRKKLTP